MRPSGPASRHEALPGRHTRRANGCTNIPLYFSEQESGAGKIPDKKERETKKTAGRNGNGPRRTDRQNGSFTDSPDKERRRIRLRPRGFLDRHDLNTLLTGKIATPVVRSGHRDKDRQDKRAPDDFPTTAFREGLGHEGCAVRNEDIAPKLCRIVRSSHPVRPPKLGRTPPQRENGRTIARRRAIQTAGTRRLRIFSGPATTAAHNKIRFRSATPRLRTPPPHLSSPDTGNRMQRLSPCRRHPHSGNRPSSAVRREQRGPSPTYALRHMVPRTERKVRAGGPFTPRSEPARAPHGSDCRSERRDGSRPRRSFREN